MSMQPGGVHPLENPKGESYKWVAYILLDGETRFLPGEFPSAAQAKEFMRQYVALYNESIKNEAANIPNHC